jgi:hypothetical protein
MLEHVPASWKIIQHMHVKFTCRACVTQTLARPHPGVVPDIGVLEVRADESVSIVAVNREDAKALGANTHIALANHPGGLGAIKARANRYRLYLQNGVVTRVEPLGRATQTPELVGAIGRALQRNRLVPQNGTIIDLSIGKADDALKKIIFPR